MKVVLGVVAALLIFALAAQPQDSTVCKSCRSAGSSSACLSDAEMLSHVRRLEMESLGGVESARITAPVTLLVTFGKNGRVLHAKALYGHPIVVPRLLRATKKWEFEPYIKNGEPRQACGRLKVKLTADAYSAAVEAVR